MILVSKLCTDPQGEILVVLDTVGKSLGHLQLGNLFNLHQARVSPAGNQLAFILLNGKEDKRRVGNARTV